MNRRTGFDTPTGTAAWVALALSSAGCASSAGQRYDQLRAELARAMPERRAFEPGDDLGALDRVAQLERRAFIRAVLDRNPSVAAARHAWRAALAQYPQATALDDPMLEYAFAPLSIGSDDASFGQQVSVTQRFPWPGKLALQGQVKLAEAEAARDNYEATRLRLALMASLLFDQYYVNARSFELNEQHRALIADIKAAAEAQYEVGRVAQQEPLQADLELAHVLHQRIVLESRRAVIVAQMNQLIHRKPQLPLPPPPSQLEFSLEPVPDSAVLQAQALELRPELRAAGAELRGWQSGVELADRAFYPDFGVMGSYNSMWNMPEHQWMLGLSIEVPIQLGARRGAVEEAEAQVAQTRSRLAAIADEIRAEVEQARQQLIEAQHVVRLYRERLLPTVRAQIEAARIAYATGRGSFQALIDAERSLRSLELAYEEALAGLQQRQAELTRSLGRLPGFPGEEAAQ